MVYGGADEQQMEQAKEVQGQAGDAVDHAKGCKGQICTMVETFTTPVGGPCICRIFYIILAIGAVAMFLYTFITACQEWMEPVTVVTTEFQTEMPYPDVYICLPSVYVSQINDKRKTEISDTFHFEFVGIPKSKDGKIDMTKFCTSFGTLKEPVGVMTTGATECLSDKVIEVSNEVMQRGMKWKDATGTTRSGSDGTEYNLQFDAASDITKLANSQVKTKAEDGTTTDYPPYCFKMANSNNVKAKYDQNMAMMARFDWSLDKSSLTNPFSFNVFLNTPGASPNKEITKPDKSKVEIINVTEMFLPGGGINVVELTVDYVKDATKGDKEFHANYIGKVTNHPMGYLGLGYKPTKCDSTAAAEKTTAAKKWGKTCDSVASDNCAYECSSKIDPVSDADVNDPSKPYISSYTAIRFSSFVTRKVTIRPVTPSEIWAKIGGIWAASILIIGVFFKMSGHLNKDGKQVSVFKWAPNKMQKGWLKDTTPMETFEESMERRVKELEAKLAGRAQDMQSTPV